MKDAERRMKFNSRILREVAPLLVAAFENQTHLYAEMGYELPQDNFYRLGLSDSLLKWTLFFTCIATVYGASSDIMFRNIAAAFERDRKRTAKFFDPKFLVKIEKSELAEKLRSFGIHRQNEMADRWKKTAEYLVEIECEDPTFLFQGAGSVSNFLKQHSIAGRKHKKGQPKQGISGLAGKTASLFVIFCKERGWLLNIPDAFPVDIWVARICWQLGVLSGEGYFLNEEIESFLRPRLARFCTREKINVTVLNGAIWRLGATLCKKGPKCDWFNCPVLGYCRGFARGATPHHAKAKGGIRGMDLSNPLIKLIRRPHQLTLIV